MSNGPQRGRLGSPTVVVTRADGSQTVVGGSPESRERVRERVRSGQSAREATRGETSVAAVAGTEAQRQQEERSRIEAEEQRQREVEAQAQAEDQQIRTVRRVVTPFSSQQSFVSEEPQRAEIRRAQTLAREAQPQQTFLVTLGDPTPEQVEEVRRQVGQRGTAVATPAGLAFRFTGTPPEEGITITGRETVEQREARVARQEAEATFAQASRPQQIGISLTAGITNILSGRGLESIRDEQVRRDIIAESITARQRRTQQGGFAFAAGGDIFGAVTRGPFLPPVARGAGTLGVRGVTAVGRRVAPTRAGQRATQFFAARPRGTRALVRGTQVGATGVIVGIEGIRAAQFAQEGRSATFVAGEIGRDIIGIGAFQSGATRAVRAVQAARPEPGVILGARTREAAVSLGRRPAPGRRDIATERLEDFTTRGVGFRPASELLEVQRRGRVVRTIRDPDELSRVLPGRRVRGSDIVVQEREFRGLRILEDVSGRPLTQVQEITPGSLVREFGQVRTRQAGFGAVRGQQFRGVEFRTTEGAFIPIAPPRPPSPVRGFIRSRRGTARLVPPQPRPQVAQPIRPQISGPRGPNIGQFQQIGVRAFDPVRQFQRAPAFGFFNFGRGQERGTTTRRAVDTRQSQRPTTSQDIRQAPTTRTDIGQTQRPRLDQPQAQIFTPAFPTPTRTPTTPRTPTPGRPGAPVIPPFVPLLPGSLGTLGRPRGRRAGRVRFFDELAISRNILTRGRRRFF